MESFPKFILEHDGADTFDVRFLTSVRQQFGADAERVISTLAVRKKLKDKVPQWFAEPSLVYPKPLAGEQCSSSATAFYKASLLRSLAASAGKSALRVADLTGGLGIDSWAFSQVAEEVLYNEMDAELADAARGNFAALGCTNIRVSCAEITPDSLPSVLGDYAPDVIFLDPARRSASGRKVFRLADCSPDLIALKYSLLQLCPYVLVKVSPMADIAQLGRELGDCLQAVHCVAVGDECKELLLVLQSGDQTGDLSDDLSDDLSGTGRLRVAEDERKCSSQPVRTGLYAVQLSGSWAGANSHCVAENKGKCSPVAIGSSQNNPTAAGTINTGKEEYAILDCSERGEASFLDDEDALREAGMLFVPGPALTKAGAFNLLCSRFVLRKLGHSTHLYVPSGSDLPAELRLLGKRYRICAVLPFDKTGIREAATRWPKADVTARNLPLDSEGLRKRLGIKTGGAIHLFGFRADFRNGTSGKYLLAAEPYNELI